jgi:vacuolar-type H+-ATPase subunit E/Vma4
VGLDDLLERMRRETEEQVTALLSEARASAERSAQEAQVAMTWERSKRLAGKDNQLRADTELALEKVRREAQQEMHGARREVADRVVERAVALAPELVGNPSYVDSIQVALDEAIQVLGGRQGRLTISPDLVDRMRSRIPPGIEIIVDESESGFRLRAADGRVEIRETIQDQLRRLTPALRIVAAAALEREA